MPKAPKKPAPAKKTTAKLAAELEPVSGSQADYERFLPAAQKLAPTLVLVMRADPQLALHNIQLGVAAVLAEKARLEKLPETSADDLAALPDLALALIFADTQVTDGSPDTGIAAMLERARELRGKLLAAAQSLVAAGLFDAKKVADILAGHGPIDAARDCVDLSALFRKNAATIKGKHPITAAQIKDAEQVGSALLKVLKPGRAKKQKAAPAVGADERNRMWTLLNQGYEGLWKAGAYLFGRAAVDGKVPPLQAGRGGPQKQKTPSPAPTTPGTGTGPATPAATQVLKKKAKRKRR